MILQDTVECSAEQQYKRTLNSSRQYRYWITASHFLPVTYVGPIDKRNSFFQIFFSKLVLKLFICCLVQWHDKPPQILHLQHLIKRHWSHLNAGWIFSMGLKSNDLFNLEFPLVFCVELLFCFCSSYPSSWGNTKIHTRRIISPKALLQLQSKWSGW